jgi:hypothetical protein
MASMASAERRSAETTSPELALVDPLLGHRVRECLPEPSDTLARIDLDLTRRRLTALAENAVAIAGAPQQQYAPKSWSSRSPRLSRVLAGGGLVAAGLVAVLLVGVNVDVRGTPAGADSTSSAPPRAHVPTQPVTTHKPRAIPDQSQSRKAHSKPPNADRPHALEPRRFAWAPVAGASAYRVEFFRGNSRIFSSVTSDPQLTLPPSWSYESRKEQLTPGIYRWYAWPVIAGVRQSKATVQATLAIP